MNTTDDAARNTCQEADESRLPRLFALCRHVDISGVSGAGLIAYGTQYPPAGMVTLAGLGRTTGHRSIGVYDSLAAVEAIHGHRGYTEIAWLTPASSGPPAGAEVARLLRRPEEH